TEVQVSTSPDGPWTTFAGWGATQGTSEAIYEAPQNGNYYFRARARDRVGNWEPWPDQFEVVTTVDTDIFTELRWRVDRFYNDSNRNGVWDRVGTGSVKPEITLTEVSMRFTDEEWHTLGSAIGGSWRFTQTLAPGSYTFTGEAKDADGGEWIYVETLRVDGTVDPLYAPVSTTVGLLARQDHYMPLLLANP
ncbi:MAG: hypothetical protein GTN78_17005, partial [Gemmatimonadales bacterium]|nr:hypothetical protein [Gemmatimonadales bacterium]